MDKLLMQAKNGMLVWVPEDKLSDWERAQQDQSSEAQEQKQRLKDDIKRDLYARLNKAQQRSEF